MKFRPNARLDPSQVEDVRGRSGMGGAASRSAAAGSASSASSSTSRSSCFRTAAGGPLGPLDGSTGRAAAAGPGARLRCKTGADANTREDCRIVGYVNSIQSYWSKALDELHDLEDRLLHRLDRDRLRPGDDRRRARSTAPSTRRSTSTSASSTSSARGSARATGPLAQAYVLAHEYGHHVQDQLGILDRIGNDRQGANSAGP